MSATHALERFSEALVVERLQKIVDRTDLKCLQRVVIIRGHKHDQRQGLRIKRACERDAVQQIHLDIEEQQVRRPRANRVERAAAVTVLAHDTQVALTRAKLAKRSACCRFIIYDDHVHLQDWTLRQRSGTSMANCLRPIA